MNERIIPLDKDIYRGFTLPVTYETFQYYAIVQVGDAGDYRFGLSIRDLPEPMTKTFSLDLYPDYLPDAVAYGIFDDGLKAALGFNHETWNNRLRITDIWVDPTCRRQGIGRELLAFAIREAKVLGVRMIVLETQATNVDAVSFYLAGGFTLVGFDLFCYSNADDANKEIRLELGMRLT